MKIAFCTSPLINSHSSRGIGTYTKNLLEFLKKDSKLQIQEFFDIKEVKSADVIHYPFFDLFQRSLSTQKKIPIVVTIHDVIPLVCPSHYPPGIRGSINKFLQKASLRNISAVITDSKSSKEDIGRYLGVPTDKIFPIALAPANYFHKITNTKALEKVKKKYNLPDKFAIFTGDVNWNKNLLNICQATLKVEMELVLVGKGFEEKNNLNHPEMRSFKEFLNQYSSNPKIHIIGFVDNNDLISITNLANVALLPSFAEGFGLPILEAQICGIPVITSNISSMPEVAGRGALLVDPNSVDEISRAISKIMNNREVREELIEEGFKNVEKFSWEETARETIKVYDKVLHS